MLAILIFPHERTPEALGELLDDYDGPIDEIICVKYSAEPNGRVRLMADNGTSEIIDAKSVKNLPRLLRNSIAHFNIKPLNVDGQFGGIRVWNRTMKGKINFVAGLNFDAFRPLARHILSNLCDREKTDLFDPPDPLPELKRQARSAKMDEMNTPKTTQKRARSRSSRP